MLRLGQSRTSERGNFDRLVAATFRSPSFNGTPKVSATPIAYFYSLFSSSRRWDELAEFRGKIIGCLCNFVPEELILAAGAVPVRLCAGSHETLRAAEEHLPRDVCPLVRSTFGSMIYGIEPFPLCDLIIVPTPCDAKKKLGELLSAHLPVWMLELPYAKDQAEAPERWFEEIRQFKASLEEFTDNRISKRSLRWAIDLLQRRQTVFRRLLELRKHSPALISGSDFFLVVQSSFFDEASRWIEQVKALCQELENELKARLEAKAEIQSPKGTGGPEHSKNDNIPRLLITGAPVIWPNHKLIRLIEESGASVIADDLCSGTQRLYDPVVVDEWTSQGMLRAIADRYLLPSTCPCFVGSEDRVRKITWLAQEYQVDGILYHSLRLCQLFDIESARIAEALRACEIPMLKIQTDYTAEDEEPIRTRIEAFLEMLRARKENIRKL